MKPITDIYGDTATIETSEDWSRDFDAVVPVVSLTVDDDGTTACLNLRPKVARRLARRLKAAAKEAERRG